MAQNKKVRENTNLYGYYFSFFLPYFFSYLPWLQLRALLKPLCEAGLRFIIFF